MSFESNKSLRPRPTLPIQRETHSSKGTLFAVVLILVILIVGATSVVVSKLNKPIPLEFSTPWKAPQSQNITDSSTQSKGSILNSAPSIIDGF